MEKEDTLFKSKDLMTIEKYITGITKPIFDKALQEMSKNRVLVGVPGSKFCLYNPHNYRVYFDFERVNFCPENWENNPACKSGFKIKNSTEIYFNDFYGFRITFKKFQVEVWSPETKWYNISLDREGEKLFLNIHKNLVLKCRNILVELMRIVGGRSKYKPLNIVSEDKYTDENLIDLLPIKQTFHSKIFKRVYPDEKVIELHSPAYTFNMIKNKAIENVTPEILKELNKIQFIILSSKKSLFYLINNIQKLDDLMSFKEYISCLNSKDYEKFIIGLTERFGVHNG